MLKELPETAALAGDSKVTLESSSYGCVICCGSEFGKRNTCAQFRSWSDTKLGRLQLEDLFEVLEATLL